ncbi:MAG TPA: peptide chain release factor N(5)-glutamine methyltransferase [Euzebyales bacterium]
MAGDVVRRPGAAPDGRCRTPPSWSGVWSGASSPTVAELVRAVATRLDDADIDSPRADARWLVGHALGLSAAGMVRDATRRVDADAVAELAALVDRRAAREPLQLILGDVAFRGHRITVRPGVFIPRPETELLVEHALGHLHDDGVVVEPCAGTGAVACAIAVERPAVTTVAVEIEPAAADLARHNAASLGASVDVRTGHLMEPVPGALRGAVDVIVANPPYLTAAEWTTLPPEVVDWDPRVALVAGPTGHEVSDALIAAATSWLGPGGWLVLELDEHRVDETVGRSRDAGLVDVTALRDLTGRPRFVEARRR